MSDNPSNPAPERLDLQTLVEKYGTYSQIPAEAWAAYDAQNPSSMQRTVSGIQPKRRRRTK
jgi:hypothetical protein